MGIEPFRWPPDSVPEPPLGASLGPKGVGFRLLAPHATGVELCLFEKEGARPEVARIPLDRDGQGLWTGFVPDLGAGGLYGYRVDGPYRPVEGHRFNPAKLLMDPRAGAVAGSVTWNDALRGGTADVPDPRDSGPYQARSVVVDTAFDWRGDRPPATPWSDTVIYESHVRGLTRLHPEVPEEWRGTYLGLASPPVIEHLLSLGVTAVELMPVQHFTDERHLMNLGLTNYWGYSPLAWFAPHARYATAVGSGEFGAGARQVTEFKTMVQRLHRAGLEVILDMVFNHTAEGDEAGPTLSLRGIDNRLYYVTDPADRSRYVDFTGCGNTIHAGHPEVASLILECLRYWVEVMHVDGFRFDLATTLGRENGIFTSQASLLEAIGADPVLSQTKLIAEPWDVGPGGYQLGSFPSRWSGWNDRFRDATRAFWRGDAGVRGELVTRIAGSRDLLASKRRGPLGGINYVACHDGFTLEDLVSFDDKHNEANLEDNRDGRNGSLSRNWGVEGPTTDEEVLELRVRAKRNLMATLAFSHGVPMLGHGDEFGRSQGGNNNAYCQDGPLSWVDWDLDERGTAFLDFVRRVFAMRREVEVFASERFPNAEDVSWLGSGGGSMSEEEWRDGEGRVLGILWRRAVPRPLLVYVNAGNDVREVRLPEGEAGQVWGEVLNTAEVTRDGFFDGSLELAAYSMIVLRRGCGTS